MGKAELKRARHQRRAPILLSYFHGSTDYQSPGLSFIDWPV